ncbi:MAG: lipid-A-disaccharide synthase N-terminal domain-containing protein [Chthoniobacteraceae bacterium]
MQFLETIAMLKLFGYQFNPLEINGWKIIGWLGAGTFSIRFVLQWMASERAKKSIIPRGFWEVSAIGSMLTLSYFIFYRKDSVGAMMNLLPLPIYLRNVWFVWTHKTPKHPGNAPRPAEGSDSDS